MRYIIIIPARYASTRFPGKPLAMLGGKTVIQRVYEQAKSVIDDVYVATDDDRIFSTVEGFGGKAVMTRADHKSGTDRIKEAADKILPTLNIDTEDDNDIIIINIQGDEPFVDPSQIRTLMAQFDEDFTQIATLGKPFTTLEALENPNSPKIVVDNHGCALYFSRSVIPFIRGVDRENWIGRYPFLKHLGVYAYRKPVLDAVTALPQSSLEIAESLEQLRWLQEGYYVRVGVTDIETVGIDTPEDLQHAEEFLKNRQ